MTNLEEELLANLIKMTKESHSKIALEKIIMKMQPLIKKYARKLYFMDKDDAMQELYLSLLESINNIKKYENDAMCVSYLNKCIVNKYCYLCKMNMKYCQINDEYIEISDDIPYKENFDFIELSADIRDLLKDKNNKQKLIMHYYLFENKSDIEIALKIGVSRQYVNRIKKKFLSEYFENY